jgi:hypothetical protein
LLPERLAHKVRPRTIWLNRNRSGELSSPLGSKGERFAGAAVRACKVGRVLDARRIGQRQVDGL